MSTWSTRTVAERTTASADRPPGASLTPPAASDGAPADRIVVGYITRAHGIRGDVTVQARTDVPERRFVAGAVLHCDHPDAPLLTVASARPHSGRLLVHFTEVRDRGVAEALAGSELSIDAEDAGSPGDPEDPDSDDYWDSDIVGLRARTLDGTELGTVSEVLHTPGGELLAVDRGGRELLVPFVRDIVPTVDLAAGEVVIDPPAGLLEL